MTNAPADLRLVTFRLDRELVAADILSVERVLRYEAPRAIPDAPDWMEGVVDYQGTVVPVIDLRRRFGLPAAPHAAPTRMIVCSANGALVAIIVDAVLDVRAVTPSELSEPPALFRGLAASTCALTRRQAVGRCCTWTACSPARTGCC